MEVGYAGWRGELSNGIDLTLVRCVATGGHVVTTVAYRRLGEHQFAGVESDAGRVATFQDVDQRRRRAKISGATLVWGAAPGIEAAHMAEYFPTDTNR